MIDVSEVMGIVSGMNIDELAGKSVCYNCILSDMDLRDSLYNTEELVEGPFYSDKMCSHCYDSEKEGGETAIDGDVLSLAFDVIREFDRCREKRVIELLDS